MTGERVEEKEYSEAQRAIIDIVNRLATASGGETHDVLRQGELQLFPGPTADDPGTKLVAEVLDPSLDDGEPRVERHFGLTIVGNDGADIEAIWINVEEKTTDQFLGDGGTINPYQDSPDGAPDYAILSFMDRYFIAQTLQQTPELVK